MLFQRHTRVSEHSTKSFCICSIPHQTGNCTDSELLLTTLKSHVKSFVSHHYRVTLIIMTLLTIRINNHSWMSMRPKGRSQKRVSVNKRRIDRIEYCKCRIERLNEELCTIVHTPLSKKQMTKKKQFNNSIMDLLDRVSLFRALSLMKRRMVMK